MAAHEHMACVARAAERGTQYGLRLSEEFEDSPGEVRPLNVSPRFWPFQLIEGGWLLVVAVLLLAATARFMRHRAA